MREFLRGYTEPPQVVPWTIWVDTCALLDVDTTISITKNLPRGDAVVESTRLLARSAAWMALALHIRDEVSVTAGYEAARKLREEATPGTLDGAWTHLVANIVREYVCPNWRVRHTLEGEAPADVEKKDRNNAHDDFMIDICLRDVRPLITSDGPAYKKAKRRGVNVMTPEEYASNVVSFERARSMFMKRLDHGITTFLSRHNGAGHAPENCELMRNAYCWMWGD
jgi:hypothetical protein